MASVLDVAQYILKRHGPMTAMKLQKLVYYAQAWSIVWDDKALFPEPIWAWKNGPVVRELYDAHKGQYRVDAIAGGDPANLSDVERDTIHLVLDFYGDKSAQWLSDLTHMEDPWERAWYGAEPEERGNTEIALEAISEYYSSLEPDGETSSEAAAQ